MSSRSRRSDDQTGNNHTNTTGGSHLFDPSMLYDDDDEFDFYDSQSNTISDSDSDLDPDSDDNIIILPNRDQTRASSANNSTGTRRQAPTEPTSDGRRNKRRKITLRNCNGTTPNYREASTPYNVEELESHDDEVEEEEDDDDDEIVILGSDGETEEKSKTTADMLKESNNNSTKFLKEVTCPICFDEIKQCVASPCGHFFCSNCVYKALASSKVSSNASGCCALCRKTVNYKDLVWLKFRFLKKET
ncbi:unnamed protein product [Ambrosiozyma monospora]|uniref:Unnamed protein product n=1 Tax=Ambrosiozyma monospora TaxID=43982 RepID=A0A9W6YSN0_AMBMO|nr:unnamed protein product [Ambrosiozyma monospora]